MNLIELRSVVPTSVSDISRAFSNARFEAVNDGVELKERVVSLTP